MMLTVNLIELGRAGPKQTAIINRAIGLLQKAINHPDFQSGVIMATYSGAWFEPMGRQLTTAEIYAVISGGIESGATADGAIDLKIRLGRKRRGILGSTPLGRFPITTAYWLVDDCIALDQPEELAGHFMHEWLHVAGFYHYPKKGVQRDVPYVVGELVRTLLAPHSANKAAVDIHARILHADCGEGESDADDDGAEGAPA